jgi:Ca-activated chloride channel family protein
MMYRLLTISIMMIGLHTWGQDEIKRNLYYGNQAYNEGDFETALDHFQEAVDRSPLNYKANFNLANAYHRMNKQDEAIERYETIVNLAPSSFDKSKVYHNIGNAKMFKQDLDGAIEAYKAALRLNPSDEETRYNLAYAQHLKREQQQQDQNQNQNQNQNQDQNSGDDQNMGDNQNNDGNNNQDSNGNQDEENQNGDQDNDDGQDEGDQNQNQGQGDNNQPQNKDEKDGNGQNYTSKLSKEQIKNILDQYYKRERELQKKLNKDKKVGYGSPQKKDW